MIYFQISKQATPFFQATEFRHHYTQALPYPLPSDKENGTCSSLTTDEHYRNKLFQSTRSITQRGVDGRPVAFTVDGHNRAAMIQVSSRYSRRGKTFSIDKFHVIFTVGNTVSKKYDGMNGICLLFFLVNIIFLSSSAPLSRFLPLFYISISYSFCNASSSFLFTIIYFIFHILSFNRS